MYETISETNLNFYISSFKPNYYVDISYELKEKIKIAKIFKNEIKYPFPRSEESIKSLACLEEQNVIKNLQSLIKLYL